MDINEYILKNFTEFIPKDLPKIKKFSGSRLESVKPLTDSKMIINALKTVVDPDICVDVYNLGLIYKYDLKKNGDVYIDMTLTSPTCPYANELVQASADAVADLDGVGRVEINVVWTPKWDLSCLTDEARFQLELE